MNGKHTPGPWSVAHIAETDTKCDCRYVFADGQTGMGAVAEICDPNDEENPPRDEAIANARLIAAAPEMLGALKIARADLSAAFRQLVGSERHSATIKAIDAAIAKAEGRDNAPHDQD